MPREKEATEAGQARPSSVEETPPKPADTSRLGPLAQRQIRERENWFARILARPGLTPKERARAHGELGNLYHAYELLDAAEASYRRALSLAPESFEWNYYLGQLYREQNRDQESVEALERAVTLDPGSAPARIRLGELLADLERYDQARQHLETALELDPEAAAAHAALGRIAAAFARAEDGADAPLEAAIAHFEAALRLQPEASALHSPLALAYRDRGDLEQAERHLELAGKVDVSLRDLFMLALYGLSEGQLQAAARGRQALAEGRADRALEDLRQAVALDPLFALNRSLLGLALQASGDLDGALEQHRLAVQLTPEDASAHFQLAQLLARLDHLEEAEEHYRLGLERQPDDTAARYDLARVLEARGRPAEAAEAFSSVLELRPELVAAWLGEAAALAELDAWSAARERLERGLEQVTDDRMLDHALARLLAAAPDPTVRDGERALDLALELAHEAAAPAHAEAVAMALAELGRFEEAVEWQRGAIVAAERLDLRSEIVSGLRQHLAQLERGEPLRRPWSAERWELGAAEVPAPGAR